MNANALDTALVKLAAASTALERHAPTPADVEEARDAAKAATKLLDAAFTLMSCGIYSVAESPTEARYNDTNDYKIAIPEIREELVAEAPAPLAPFPSILTEWDTWDESEQLNEFERRLDLLRTSLPDAGELDLTPWDQAWAMDNKAAFICLLVAEVREPRTFAVPTAEEVSAWCAQFADPEVSPAVEPEYLVHWRGWDADEQLRQFEALLGLLEDAGIEEGRKLKEWKKAVRPWQDLFIQDREKAWGLLCRAYYTIVPISWDVPADVVEAPTEAPAEILAESDPFEAGTVAP